MLYYVFALIALILPNAGVRCQEPSGQPTSHVILQASARYKGLAYKGAVRDNALDAEAVRTDMRLLADIGVRWIRMYSIDSGQEVVPSIAKDFGIDTFIGIAVAENMTAEGFRVQVGRLEEIFKRDPRLKPIVVVGNEVLRSKTLPLEELASFFKYVQRRGFLTAVADVPTALLSPEAIPVLKDVDILLLHVHPFYERVQDITGRAGPHSRLTPDAAAAEYVVQVAMKVQRTYPDRVVVIGETGWPRRDDTTRANPTHCLWCTPAHQRDFIRVLTSRVTANGIGMFLYEAFDEVLKMHSPEESGTAPYWGIFTADRGPMPAVPVVREWLMSEGPVVVDAEMVCAGMESMAECGPAPGATDTRVQEVLDRVCGAGVICPYMDFPLMARCGLRPKTSWALSQYYMLHDRQRAACDFDGAATVRVTVGENPRLGPNLPLIRAVAHVAEALGAEDEPPPTEAPTRAFPSLSVLTAVVVGGALLASRRAWVSTRPPRGADEVELTAACSARPPSAQPYGALGHSPVDMYAFLD